MMSYIINSSFLVIMFLQSFLFLSCTDRVRDNFDEFAGFWVTEDGANFIYITNEYALCDINLGCINPLVNENNVFYLVDSCVNVVNHFNYSNHKNKFRINLNKNNQLLIYYDNDNPDIPWVFDQLEIKDCEPQIVEIRLNIVGLVGSYSYYENEIIINLVEDEVFINGTIKENSKSISWLKTYCYNAISTKRKDIDLPPAPTGVKPIFIELIFDDGKNELITIDSLISAPLEVQALVLFLVSFLA